MNGEYNYNSIYSSICVSFSILNGKIAVNKDFYVVIKLTNYFGASFDECLIRLELTELRLKTIIIYDKRT
jgi:hypothetical protein